MTKFVYCLFSDKFLLMSIKKIRKEEEVIFNCIKAFLNKVQNNEFIRENYIKPYLILLLFTKKKMYFIFDTIM